MFGDKDTIAARAAFTAASRRHFDIIKLFLDAAEGGATDTQMRRAKALRDGHSEMQKIMQTGWQNPETNAPDTILNAALYYARKTKKAEETAEAITARQIEKYWNNPLPVIIEKVKAYIASEAVMRKADAPSASR